MIFQLRDRQLKLFVGLLLILRQGPEHCEGYSQECYICGFGGPPVDCSKEDNLGITICTGDIPECFKSNVGGSMKRGCYSQAWTMCILERIPDGCYNATVHKHLNPWLKDCVTNSYYSGPKEKLDPPEGTLCVCGGERLCNGGPAEVATTETPLSKPGLSCYSCKGRPDDCKSTRVCAQGEYCAEESYFDKRAKVADRWCLPQRQAECIKNNYGNCWTSKSPLERTDLWTSIEKCADPTTKLSLRQETDVGGKEYTTKMCICDKDLCNGNPPNLAGASTSDGKLIFVILTAGAASQRIFLSES